jgi:hypothetical protein
MRQVRAGIQRRAEGASKEDAEPAALESVQLCIAKKARVICCVAGVQRFGGSTDTVSASSKTFLILQRLARRHRLERAFVGAMSARGIERGDHDLVRARIQMSVEA